MSLWERAEVQKVLCELRDTRPVPPRCDVRCYDFEGCHDGYPVKVCTFDGAHTPSSVNDGATNGDDGLNAFVPPLAWEFISQL